MSWQTSLFYIYKFIVIVFPFVQNRIAILDPFSYLSSKSNWNLKYIPFLCWHRINSLSVTPMFTLSLCVPAGVDSSQTLLKSYYLIAYRTETVFLMSHQQAANNRLMWFVKLHLQRFTFLIGLPPAKNWFQSSPNQVNHHLHLKMCKMKREQGSLNIQCTNLKF